MKRAFFATAMALGVCSTQINASYAMLIPCRDREDAVKTLEKLGEYQHSVGVTTGGNMFEIFRSKDGSWTAFVTSPKGRSCLIGVGSGFTDVPLPPEGEPT